MFQALAPNKVPSVGGKQGRKQKYEHRNPPIEVTKSQVQGRDNQSSKTKTQFAPKPGLVQCRNCSRSFCAERIEVHSTICKKTNNKKRKPFDAAKAKIFDFSVCQLSRSDLQARVGGTEAAAYRKRGNNISKTKVENFTDVVSFL